jgi:hypothetical protein
MVSAQYAPQVHFRSAAGRHQANGDQSKVPAFPPHGAAILQALQDAGSPPQAAV